MIWNIWNYAWMDGNRDLKSQMSGASGATRTGGVTRMAGPAAAAKNLLAFESNDQSTKF